MNFEYRCLHMSALKPGTFTGWHFVATGGAGGAASALLSPEGGLAAAEKGPLSVGDSWPSTSLPIGLEDTGSVATGG
eukprot:SAG31_NODE_236_length_19594_cov_7.018620_20_plen_76_part_01